MKLLMAVSEKSLDTLLLGFAIHMFLRGNKMENGKMMDIGRLREQFTIWSSRVRYKVLVDMCIS